MHTERIPMKISPEEVRHVADLARLDLNEELVELFTTQLNSLLGYMEKLNELDTTGVEPHQPRGGYEECVSRGRGHRIPAFGQSAGQCPPKRIEAVSWFLASSDPDFDTRRKAPLVLSAATTPQIHTIRPKDETLPSGRKPYKANPMQPYELTLTELHELFKKRELSSVEATRSVLDRIASLNPQLNSYISVTSDMALKSAQEADEVMKRGNFDPLCGIPVAVKDVICIEGIECTCGSRFCTTTSLLTTPRSFPD